MTPTMSMRTMVLPRGAPRRSGEAAASELTGMRLALATGMVAGTPPLAADELRGCATGYMTHVSSSRCGPGWRCFGQDADFDEESKALYDAVAPGHTMRRLRRIVAELERSPGQGRCSDDTRHSATGS